MKTYQKYKDSGVDWLGAIPEHWETKRSKFLWTEKTILSKGGNEQLLSVSQYYGVKANLNDSRSENLIGYKKVDKGNLVTNIMLAWLGGLGVSEINGIVSPAYSIYKATNEILPRFAHYLYRTKLYLDEFARRSSGIVPSRWRLYTDDFYEVRTILPPKPEQRAIADFLDKTCGKIDTALAQKERLIALLNERKQALIQNAVTKGLDEDVAFKDSGVDWIGDIPEGWEVKRLKYVSEVVLGKMLCNENRGNYLLKPYLKSKNIQWLNVDVSSVNNMWFSKKEMIKYKLKKGDLILSEGGEVGKTCIWNEELKECYIQNSAHKITFFENAVSKYYLYLFFIYGKRGIFDSIVNRVSIAHLTRDKLINIPIIQPPLSKQKQIVNHIDAQSQKIDRAVRQQETAIAKLKEYKASLVESCVLGEVKVV